LCDASYSSQFSWAPGCGAFQLAHGKHALLEHLEAEREIVTYRTGQELNERVGHYLGRREERAGICDRSYARAKQGHTYEPGLKRMFDILRFTGGACRPTERLGASRREQ
jgi:spore maturation protein CgeB